MKVKVKVKSKSFEICMLVCVHLNVVFMCCVFVCVTLKGSRKGQVLGGTLEGTGSQASLKKVGHPGTRWVPVWGE